MKLIDKFIDLDITKLKFTNQELAVYHYISKNINNLNIITAKEIAKECFCTTTTVNRFCKKYGVSGYGDFSAIISYELSQNEEPNLNQKVEQPNILLHIKKDVPLFLFGSGASLFTARITQRYLLRRGYIAILIEDRYFLKEVMNGQILLFSNSGETAPSLDLAASANGRGITTFAVTASGSQLANICEYSLTFINHIEKVSSYNHESQIKMYSTLLNVLD